jgi:hypothetical protein
MEMLTSTTGLKSHVEVQKMVYIYNAVESGWTVKLLPDGVYEFRKKDQKMMSSDPGGLNEYLTNFILFCSKLHPTT